jgi:hypothetical protein
MIELPDETALAVSQAAAGDSAAAGGPAPRLRASTTRSLAILDFLAMLAGLKSVYLLGRGMDAPSWVADVSRIATAIGLHVELGPY